MSALVGLLGIAFVLGVSFVISNDKRHINFKAVLTMIGMQVIVTWILLKTTIGLKVVGLVSGVFESLVSYGMEGVDFVVGGWIPEGEAPFFVTVLLVIVFTSTVLSVLTHMKILPFIIKYVGGVLSKVTGLPKVESFNAVNSIFFGQSESILAIKNHLPKMDKNRLFIISTSAMASVSAAIVGSYMTMLPANYVLMALILNMFSALIVASIFTPVPKVENDEDVEIDELISTRNFFDSISQGALDGGKVALIVAAMLIAYLGFLAMINGVLSSLVGFDLTTILSYLFAPVAWVMGVPMADVISVGSVMGTKLVANEFVAIMQVQPILDTLSSKSQGIITTFLISFSAFGSIGIIGGSVQAVNGAKAKEVSSFGLKMLLAATLASVLSGTIVGLFL